MKALTYLALGACVAILGGCGALAMNENLQEALREAGERFGEGFREINWN